MPSGNVTVVMTAADAELVRAWQRAREGPQQLQQELQKVAGKSRQVRGDSSAMFSTIIGGFTAAAISSRGFTTAMGLAHRAVSALRQEYDEFLNRQRAAAGFQGGVASAQRKALRNLGADLSPQEMVEGANRIHRETGADLTMVYEAINNTLSARGDFSSAEAIKQVEAVVKIDPSMAIEDMQALAGAALDLRKFFGGTSQQAIGALLAGQQTARVTETGEYARNIVPGLTGLHEMGKKPEAKEDLGMPLREASAMISAITQQSADVSGRRSRTAAIQFGKQVLDATGGIKELEGQGIHKRLEFLLSGDKQAEQIRRGLVGAFDQDLLKFGYTEKGELTGEAAQYMALIGLLTPGSKTQKLYQAALAQTPELTEADKVYQRNLEMQRDLGPQRTKRVEEVFRGATQRRLLDDREGMIGAVDEGLQTFLKQLGGFGAAPNVPTALTRFGEGLALQNLASGNKELGLDHPIDPRRAAAVILEQRLQRARGSGAAAQPGGAEKVEEIREVQHQLLDAALRDAEQSGDAREAEAIRRQLVPPSGAQADALQKGLLVPSRPVERPQARAARGNDEALARLDEQTGLLRVIADRLADNRVRIENPGEGARAIARGRARPAPMKSATS